MEHAKELIRRVARSFYDLHQVLLVDALMVHSALSVDDMYHLTGVQAKDLRKYLSRLREDRLVSVQQRQEVKINTTRPIHRDYYYINFHHAIDAIKYRIYHMTKKVEDLYKPTTEKKDYYCPRCKSEWTQLEVLDKASPEGFLCHKCDYPLERDELAAQDRTGSERQAKLMSQIDPLVNCLKDIDAHDIPFTDFASAMERAVPVERNKTTHPGQQYEVVKPEGQGKASANKLKSEPGVELDVHISTDAARDEEAKRLKELKAEQEKQNALPTWYSESTIGLGPSVGVKAEASNGLGSSEPTTNGGIAATTVKEEGEDSKEGILPDAHQKQMEGVEEYYAQLKREEEERFALPPQSESEGEDDDEEDDDDGFEDVEIGSTGMNGGKGTGTSGVNTPISSVSVSAPPSGALNGSGKRRRADDEDGLIGGTDTSAMGTPSGGQSPSKKVKLETDIKTDPDAETVKAPEATTNGAGAGTVKAEEEYSDEDEFEDII